MSRKPITQEEAIKRLKAYADKEKKFIVYAYHFEKSPFGISKPTVNRLFGSWENFAKAADLLAGNASRVAKEKSRDDTVRLARSFVIRRNIGCAEEYARQARVSRFLNPVTLFKKGITFEEIKPPAR